MLRYLFASFNSEAKDAREVERLIGKYGGNASSVVKERASDRSLSMRDRSHWRRISRAMKV